MALVDRMSIRRRGLAAIVAAAGCTVLALTSAVPAWAAAQETPTAPEAFASADGERAASRKTKNDVGIRGRGFVADNGVFTTIDVPDATTFTAALGTNEAGQTVGAYVDRRGRLHAFLRDGGGTVTRIDYPRAGATVAWRINALGQIVGAYSEDAETPALDLPHGFLLDNGVFTTIDVPGAVRTYPHGINNRGQIVGEYLDLAGKYHGFLLDDGVFTTLDAPGGTSTIAFDIDDSGRIVGASLNAAALNLVNPTGAVRGFLRDAQGVYTSIEAPDSAQTVAFGINNAGQIAGKYLDAQSRQRGFLLDRGVFTTIDATPPGRVTLVVDINDRGQLTGGFDFVTHGSVRDRRGHFIPIDHPDAVVITHPFGINNRGQIVGFYTDATLVTHAFLRDRDGFTTIDMPGALLSAANRINDAGQIVGIYNALDGSAFFPVRGYLVDHGAVTEIDVPGALHTQPSDIDNAGRIAGSYQDAAGVFHGFLRDASGTFTTIDLPGAVVTIINGINDAGSMVGQYFDATGVARGFLRDASGAIAPIEVPGATVTSVRDINNAGDIVGTFIDEATVRGFILSRGTFTVIDDPDNVANGTHSNGIDDRGRIVGLRD